MNRKTLRKRKASSVERQQGRNKATIEIAGNNQTLIRPPVCKAAVFSGGGARGVAYAGMIDAMSAKEGFIEGLTHVSGSSAGAMTASLLAIGMSAENIKKIILELNLKNLMDRGRFSFRAKGDRFRNALDIAYMLQLDEHLQKISPNKTLPPEVIRLKEKIQAYKQALEAQGLDIKNLDALLELSKDSKKVKQIDKVFLNTPKKDKITFSDVNALKRILPNTIKNLTVTVTNQTTNQLEIYNQTSQESLAETVQISGAHPLLFIPRKDSKGHLKADGGILDNMPAEALIKKEGVDQEEILCVYTQQHSEFASRSAMGKTHARENRTGLGRLLDAIFKKIFGGAVKEKVAATRNAEKVFYHNHNMLYLNTFRIAVDSMNASLEEKMAVIEQCRQSTEQFLNERVKKFDHPFLAMLNLGEEKLVEIIVDQTNASFDEVSPDFRYFAAQSKILFSLQKDLRSELSAYHASKNKKDKDQLLVEIAISIGNMMDILAQPGRSKIDLSIQNKALRLCLHQVDYMAEGKLRPCLEALAKLDYQDDRMVARQVFKGFLLPIDSISRSDWRSSLGAPQITVETHDLLDEDYAAMNSSLFEKAPELKKVNLKLEEQDLLDEAHPGTEASLFDRTKK